MAELGSQLSHVVPQASHPAVTGDAGHGRITPNGWGSFLGNLLRDFVSHVMVVAKQPVVVLSPVFDLLEEVRQVVRHIVPGELEGNAGGGAVGEDVVHRPAAGIQVPSGLCIFLL